MHEHLRILSPLHPACPKPAPRIPPSPGLAPPILPVPKSWHTQPSCPAIPAPREKRYPNPGATILLVSKSWHPSLLPPDSVTIIPPAPKSWHPSACPSPGRSCGPQAEIHTFPVPLRNCQKLCLCLRDPQGPVAVAPGEKPSLQR